LELTVGKAIDAAPDITFFLMTKQCKIAA